MPRCFLLALLLLSACAPGDPERVPGTAGPARLEIRTDEGLVEIDVDVADDEGERSVGLMGRDHLPSDAGMVFLWENPVHTTFWMKDTLIPLSIAFWGEQGRILSILDMEPCEADPCPSYDPGVEFVAAVEVNQGFFEAHGIDVGDRVELAETEAT